MPLATHPLTGTDLPRLTPSSTARCDECDGGAYAGAPDSRASVLPLDHAVGACEALEEELLLLQGDLELAHRSHGDLAQRDPRPEGTPWAAINLRDVSSVEVAQLAALGIEVDPGSEVLTHYGDGTRTRVFTTSAGEAISW